jgi:hypothetical protein
MRGPLAAAVFVLALQAGCAGPGSPGPVPFRDDDVGAIDVDGVVGLTTGLLLAAQTGPDDLLRALEERLGPRARRVPGGLAVSSSSPPSLTLAFDLRTLPTCRDPSGGVVVGEPPRVLGCGAHRLAMLAAFVVAVERHADVALLVVDGPVDGVPPVAWVAGDSDIVRVDDQEVFEVAVVDAGAVDLRLRLAGDDDNLDRLVVAAGRTLAWRSAPREAQVLRDRAAGWPRGMWWWIPGAGASPPTDPDLVTERCRLREPPTSSSVRLRCHLLPGRAATDVVADVLRAIDDPAIVVTVEATHDVSATPWTSPLVDAIRGSLAAAGVGTVPTLQVAPAPSLCAVWRAGHGACVQGTPLRLHPAARDAVGTPAESVDVIDVGRLAVRVDAVVRALRRSS